MAELELAQQQAENARKYLRQARRNDPESVRAHFIAAGIAEQKGDFVEAMTVYEQIVELDSDYLPDLLDAYFEAAQSAEQLEHAADQLEVWSGQYEGISLVLQQASLMEENQTAADAAKLISNSLRERPSVKGLEKLMSLKQKTDAEIDTGEDILHSITLELMSSQSSYRCSHCGFSGQSHHWQCPSCKQWSTTRVIRGVLGE
jgi:lipopolysaccharide biosynthesis regulator YciM